MYVSPQDWGIWSVWIMIRWMPTISTLLRGEKYLKNCDKSHIKKNNKPHIFTPPWPLGSGGVKIWFFVFKYKIGNNDFTTILGSVNVKNMTPTTICSSNPTENVLGGSIDHTESPWTLNITSVLGTTYLTCRPHFWVQKQIYHISDIFYKWISTWSSVLRIGIHRIELYVYGIYPFFDETYE